MSLRLTFLLAAAVLSTGCDQIILRKPKTEDLAGEYAPSKHAERYLKEQKKYSSVAGSLVVLSANGAITLRNIPDCAFSPTGDSKNELLSGAGTWTLAKWGVTYGLNMSIKKGGTIEDGHYGGPWLHLRKRASYLIEFNVGDPDSGNFLLYEKRANQTPEPTSTAAAR